MRNFLFRLILVFLFLGGGAAFAQDAANSRPLTSSLNITTGTVLKPSPGVLVCFNVTTAGAVGTISDTTTTAAVAAANLIAVIPAVVGVYCSQFPFFSGLVVVPGAAQVVSISYR